MTPEQQARILQALDRAIVLRRASIKASNAAARAGTAAAEAEFAHEQALAELDRLQDEVARDGQHQQPEGACP